ncbi:MAG: PLP-dependent aminotransferase family protein [Rhodoferax sp.]
MELHVVIDGDRDLTGQLYRQLRGAIRSGRLAAGEKLPPTRLLAERLGLSRKTVAEAYARLGYDKLLVGKVGSGSFVGTGLGPPPTQHPAATIAGAAVLARWSNMSSPLRLAGLDGTSRYEYMAGVPARNLFPHEVWRRCVHHALRQAAKSRGMYGQTEGLPQLRDAIARHVAFTRGVRSTLDDIIVTTGAQQALDLVARVLLEPGCTVAVEEPGYPPARLLMAAQGAHVVGIPVDEEGMQVDQIPDGTRLIYVTPSHQFPLGMVMSQARREALLARAHALGVIIIEDDYDGEFRYGGRPVESLQSQDRHGSVAFIGSFSKNLSPELRLGYLIAPQAILKAVSTVKHLTDWHTSLPAQWALAKFITDGELLKHIRHCHAEYTLRRERLTHRFATDLAPWFDLVPAHAGIHLAALCKVPMDMDLLARLARRVDVGVYALDVFYHFSPARPGLLLGFGEIASADIDPSLDRLRDVLSQMTA